MFLKHLSTPFLTPHLLSEPVDFEFPIIYKQFIGTLKKLNPHYKPIDQSLNICNQQYLTSSDLEKNDIHRAFSTLTTILNEVRYLQTLRNAHPVSNLLNSCHDIISELLLSPSKRVISHGLVLLQGLNSVFQDQEAFRLTGFHFEIQWNAYFYLWADISSKTKIKALDTFLKQDDFANFLFNLIHEKKDNVDFLSRIFHVLHGLNTLLWQSQYDLETKLISSRTIDILMFFMGCLLWHQITDPSKSNLMLFFLEPLHLTRLLNFHENFQAYLKNNYPSLLKENMKQLNETLFNVLSSRINEDGIFRTQFLTLLEQVTSTDDAIFLSMYVKFSKQLLETAENSTME